MAEIDRLEADLARVTAERDTLIRQRAADLDALNAVQALHAQAVAERDEARRQVEAMRRCLADTCFVLLTDKAVTDTLWSARSNLVTVVDDIANALGVDTVAPDGGPSDALRAAMSVAVPSTEVEG